MGSEQACCPFDDWYFLADFGRQCSEYCGEGNLWSLCEDTTTTTGGTGTTPTWCGNDLYDVNTQACCYEYINSDYEYFVVGIDESCQDQPDDSCDDDFEADFDSNFIHGDYTIRPFGVDATSVCLVDDDNTVKVASCNSTDSASWWYYDVQAGVHSKQISSFHKYDMCWTAAGKTSARKAITMTTCQPGNELQSFVQVNGRIHLEANMKLCAAFSPGKFEKNHAKDADFTLEVTMGSCNPQVFGEDTISADSCTGDQNDHNSGAKLVSLINKNKQIRAFKDEHSKGTCLFKSGSTAKIGQCKNKGAYKMKYSAKSGQLKQGKNCLTAASTSKGGTVKFSKCSKKKSTKQKQQWKWIDGKLVLKKQPRIALQYVYNSAKNGKSIKAKTSWALSTLFGDAFTHNAGYISSTYSSSTSWSSR